MRKSITTVFMGISALGYRYWWKILIRGLHIGLNFICYSHRKLGKCLGYINVLFCTDLHEDTFERVGKHSTLFDTNLAIISKIAFVANDYFRQFACTVLIQLNHPVWNIFKGSPIINTIYNNYARCSSKISIR